MAFETYVDAEEGCLWGVEGGRIRQAIGRAVIGGPLGYAPQPIKKMAESIVHPMMAYDPNGTTPWLHLRSAKEFRLWQDMVCEGAVFDRDDRQGFLTVALTHASDDRPVEPLDICGAIHTLAEASWDDHTASVAAYEVAQHGYEWVMLLSPRASYGLERFAVDAIACWATSIRTDRDEAFYRAMDRLIALRRTRESEAHAETAAREAERNAALPDIFESLEQIVAAAETAGSGTAA